MIAMSTGLWLVLRPFAASIAFSAAVEAEPHEHPVLMNLMHF